MKAFSKPWKKSMDAGDGGEVADLKELSPGKRSPANAVPDEEEAGPLKKKWQQHVPDVVAADVPRPADDIQSKLREAEVEKNRAWVEQDARERAEAARLRNIEQRANRLGFKYIETNAFLHREPRELDYEDADQCQCSKRHRNCDSEKCTNMSAMTECVPGRCRADDCQNQRFQKRQWIPFGLVKRGRLGYGVVALQDVPKGGFVMEYVGEIIDEDEKQDRIDAGGVRHHYTMELNKGEYIDPQRAGNFGRFLNHSCDPNCQTQKWMVLGESRMGFFARRFIAKGEELTFDYQFEREGNISQRCLCGSEQCRGWLGAKRKNKRAIGESGGGEGGAGDDSASEEVEEQSYDEMEDDDVLGLGNNAVQPSDPIQSVADTFVAPDNQLLFNVTLDLLPSLMRSAKRDAALPRARRAFLGRNVRSGLATFHRALELDAPLAAIVRENQRPRRPFSALTRTAADRRQSVEAALQSAK